MSRSPRIHVRVFAGLRPFVYTTKRNRQVAGGVAADLADIAENVYLHDGTLRGYSQDTVESVLSFTPRTIYKAKALECCPTVLAHERCVSYTEAKPDVCGTWDEVLVWAAEPGQEHKRLNPCTGEAHRLWVEAPMSAPSVAVATASVLEAHACGPTHEQLCGEGDNQNCNVDTAKGPDEISYTTTYVDKFGVESPPGPPSTPVRKWDDQHLTLTNLAVNPPPNAVCVRLYRTSSSFNTDPKANKVGHDTSWQLVDELPLPLAGGTFTDTRRLVDIEWGTLLTHRDCPPPPCMGKVEYLETGHWVGYSGNDIYFSERNEFWNWPERYRLTIPDRITGMAAFGEIVFLGTTGTPYRGQIRTGIGEDKEFDSTTTVVPYGEKYPCLQPQAMVATSWGAAYVSHEGIIGLQTSGVASNLTRNRVDEDEWMRWAPNQLAWHDGRLYGTRTPTEQTIVLDFPEKGEGRGIDLGDFHVLKLRMDTLHGGTDGRLWFTQGGTLYTLGTARGRKAYRWRSRVFRMAGLSRLGAYQVFGEFGKPVTLKLWSDGHLIATEYVKSSEPRWLPMACRGRDFQFEVTGTTTVSEVHIAASIRELDAQPRFIPGAMEVVN